MPMAASTTIKVPVALRDRINHDAGALGVSAAALLEQLLDDYERAQRLASVREAYAQLPADDDYWGEIAAWDATLADGLPRE